MCGNGPHFCHASAYARPYFPVMPHLAAAHPHTRHASVCVANRQGISKRDPWTRTDVLEG